MKLSHEDLNRALLARQGLLAPLEAPTLAAVFETIGAVQAQYWPAVAQSVFARTRGYTLADVYTAFEQRELVVGSSIRGTVHAVSAAEHPVYAAVAESTGVDTARSKDGAADPGLVALRAAVLDFTKEQPRSAAEIQEFAAELGPDQPREAERGQPRVPRGPRLAAGLPEQRPDPVPEGRRLVARDRTEDLPHGARPRRRPRRRPGHARPQAPGGFRPGRRGGRRDVARTAGPGRAERARRLRRPGAHEDEAGRALYDVPDGGLPGADAEAPPRLLPKFDSPLLAYGSKHRRRIVADADKEKVYLKALQVAATFLVDGFVAGGLVGGPEEEDRGADAGAVPGAEEGGREGVDGGGRADARPARAGCRRVCGGGRG